MWLWKRAERETARGLMLWHPAASSPPPPCSYYCLQSTKPEEASRMYDRHFDHKDELVSRIT